MFDARYTLSRPDLVVTVYDIAYNHNGYPIFLVYDKNTRSWMRKSAKYFVPV